VTRSAWYRDRQAWWVIARGYLPSLLALNLAWEMAQLPLYTIWSEASAGEVAFAVAHCTVGDMLIGAAALLIALVVVRAPEVADWHWVRIGAFAVIIGVGYTAVSEWMNTTIRYSWEYSSLMPLVDVRGVALGLAPLVQWLIVPPLALYLARWLYRHAL
jgi:hypothetical protein